MYREHAVGVVIPAYNEGAFVRDVIAKIPDYVDRVYVIDDCSTDHTWSEILHAGRDDAGSQTPTGSERHSVDFRGTPVEKRVAETTEIGRVVAFRHDRNRGAGGAVKTGYFAAMRDAVDIVATVDGDGQMDISQLSRLLDPLVDGEAEYAKGNRLASADTRAEMPVFRLLGNVLLSTLTKIASGYWSVNDSQNGYTAISRDALCRVDLDSLYEYYGYCNDLLVKLNVCGVRVVDVPMAAVYGDESSSISYGAYTTRVSMMLLRNFGWRLQTKYGHTPARQALLLSSLVVLALTVWFLIDFSKRVVAGSPGWPL